MVFQRATTNAANVATIANVSLENARLNVRTRAAAQGQDASGPAVVTGTFINKNVNINLDGRDH